MSEDPLFVSKEKKANPLQVIPSYLIKDSEKDSTMQRIKDYLTSHHLPEGMSAMARRRLQNQSKKFLIKAGELYKRNGFNPPVKAIFLLSRRLEILKDAHERLGHRGEYAVMQTLKQRFYWPTMWRDAQHHVKSCHECQIRRAMLIRRRDAEAGADADAETQMKIDFEAGGSSTDAARTQHGRSTDAA